MVKKWKRITCTNIHGPKPDTQHKRKPRKERRPRQAADDPSVRPGQSYCSGGIPAAVNYDHGGVALTAPLPPPPQTGVCRLRQFSITSRGGVVNRGDSLRPRRSASNTSVTSSVSSCSRERIPSIGSIASTPGCSKVPTPTSSPQYRVVMIGAAAVGKSTLITQFMTSEYMCAYDDSPVS
ncbi:uncharacterized protein LOC134766344 [Penaeus indicus]|uniref:uncharacterized protein LOC134766344 n=1 Tax=Penaeus indicus TaxID=29960 RepID=UPI00300C9E9B